VITRIALCVALAGCGRVGFDATSDATMDALLPTPVARYLFDDDLSDGAADSIGNRTLQCDGPCPTSVTAIDGMGALFAGTTIMRASGAGLESPQFSLAAWMRPSATDLCLLGKPYGSVVENSWQICLGANRDLVLCTTPDGCDFGDPFAFMLDRWIGVTVTYDGAMVRGWLGGEQSIIQPHPGPVLFDGSELIVAGDIDMGVPAEHFVGAIDDVRIWDVALEPEQVRLLIAP